MTTIPTFTPGDRINHPEFGAGVVIEPPHEGYLRAFFSVGERRVPLEALHRALSRTERILRNVQGDADRARRAWLALEAALVQYNFRDNRLNIINYPELSTGSCGASRAGVRLRS